MKKEYTVELGQSLKVVKKVFMRKRKSLDAEDQIISSSPTTSLRPIEKNKKYVRLKKNNISPKSVEVLKGKQVVDTEIETSVMDMPAIEPFPSIVVKNKRKKLVISKSSQSLEIKDMNEKYTDKVDFTLKFTREIHTQGHRINSVLTTN